MTHHDPAPAGDDGPAPEGLIGGLRWVLSRRAVSAAQLAGYARMAAIKARHPSVLFAGPVFIGPDVRFEVREGYGRILVGAWSHFGEGTRVRCHEGTLRIGPKTVLASRVTVNAWLDIDIGAACLLGEGVYVCDFDHRLDDLSVPIKDQGIVKAPVRIADDVWLGTKSTVTRGTRMARGSVLAANSVAKGDYPPFTVVAGSPARVVRLRDPQADWLRREAMDRDPRLVEVVRAVITEGPRRVLLRRLDGAASDPPGRPWACPGGVPLPGESHGEALRRLVAEQTGLMVVVADPAWSATVIAPSGRWDGRREQYLRVVVSGLDPLGESWPSRAARGEEPRWWSTDDIDTANQAHPGSVSPPGLSQRLGTLRLP